MVDRHGFRGCDLFDEGLKSLASLLGLSGASGRLRRENMEAVFLYQEKIFNHSRCVSFGKDLVDDGSVDAWCSGIEVTFGGHLILGCSALIWRKERRQQPEPQARWTP